MAAVAGGEVAGAAVGADRQAAGRQRGYHPLSGGLRSAEAAGLEAAWLRQRRVAAAAETAVVAHDRAGALDLGARVGVGETQLSLVKVRGRVS